MATESMDNLVFIDVETTSLKPPARRPWEIALVWENAEVDFALKVDWNNADQESLEKSKFYERYPYFNIAN